MFHRDADKRAIEEMAEADMAKEEETKRRLAELIAQKKAEKAEASTRTRGHATRVLRTKTDELRAMLPHLSLGEMVDLLAQADVHVNYHSLRNFLRKHMPDEYLEYVAIGQAKGGFAPIPEQLANAPMSIEEVNPVQTIANTEAEAEIQTPTSNRNNSLLDAANPRKLGIKK